LVPVIAPSRPKEGARVKRAAEEGSLVRYLSAVVAPLGISATLLVDQAVAQVEPPAPPECPIKTAVENTVIARAWHEDVIKLAIWHSQKGKTQGRQSTRLTGTEVTRDSPRHIDDAERPRCGANDYFAVGTVPPRRIF
jgi:hypothetical protein